MTHKHQEEENERIMVMKGLVAAREAFDKFLNDEEIEGAYYSLNLKCSRLNDDFSTPLWTIVDREERIKETRETRK